jgi:hypothetical protein
MDTGNYRWYGWCSKYNVRTYEDDDCEIAEEKAERKRRRADEGCLKLRGTGNVSSN